MNSTESNSTISRGPNYVFPCLYSIVFIVALILNIMAAWIFFKVPTDSTFVVYLKNLVVADILLTLTIPVKVLYYAGVCTPPLDMYVANCRYMSKVFYLTMYTSIAFLGLISLDRYLKIVWPFRKFAVQKVKVGQALSAGVWLVFSSIVITIIILTNKPPPQIIVAGEIYCPFLMSESGLAVFRASIYICQVVFWFTLVLMVVCYSFITRTVYKSYKASRNSSSEADSCKGKVKVFVVVAVFFVCFAPFHFYLVSFIDLLPQIINTACSSCGEKVIMYYYATLWLSSTNTCLDPLIYILLCKKFRTGLLVTLSCGRQPA